jgi:uncharacterized protein
MREPAQSGEPFEIDGLSAAVHRPENPTGDAIILAHGAGSNFNAPILILTARALAGAGFLAIRYNLPFRQLRPTGPPNPAHAARDREGIRQVAQAARTLGARRIFAGGHSYGARQTTMLAAEDAELFSALLLLSYPLHPPAKPGQLRTQHFPTLRTPALFVHGTKDSFGTVEEMTEALKLIPAATELVTIAGAGHDLRRARDLGALIPGRLLRLAPS